MFGLYLYQEQLELLVHWVRVVFQLFFVPSLCTPGVYDAKISKNRVTLFR